MSTQEKPRVPRTYVAAVWNVASESDKPGAEIMSVRDDKEAFALVRMQAGLGSRIKVWVFFHDGEEVALWVREPHNGRNAVLRFFSPSFDLALWRDLGK